MVGILISKWVCPPTERESIDRDGAFTSRRGPGLRPPTRRQKAALGRRAKGYGRSGRAASYGPPPVASAEGVPQAGEGVFSGFLTTSH